MKITTLILTVLISIITLFAANEKVPVVVVTTTTITGHVVDKITGEALAGVKISLNESEIIVYSDLDGNFEINNVKVGNHSIKTNLISYDSSRIDISCTIDANDIKIKLDNK